MDSAIRATAAHRASERVADGTDTSVATYMINKWTAKINEKEIYNGKCPSRAKEEKSKGKKKEDSCSSCHP